MGIYTVKNFSQGTLESGISSEDTQLTVNEGSTLPTSGTFVAVIWNPSYLEASKDPNVEIITGTLSSERTYDVVRACEGTIASNHADGDRVSLHFTAGLFSDLVGPVGPKGEKGDKGKDGSPGSAHTLSFVNGDLSNGILTVSHSLGFKYVTFQVYNNLDNAVIPDNVTLIDNNTLTVDLSGFIPLDNTWHVSISAGG